MSASGRWFGGIEGDESDTHDDTPDPEETEFDPEGNHVQRHK